MPFLHILILGLSSAVVLVWAKHHFFVLPDHWLAISLPLIVSSFLFFVLFALFRLFSKRYETLRHFSFRPVYFPLIVFGIGLLIFNTQVFLRGLLLADGPLIPLTSLVSANLSFGTKLGSVFLLFVFLTAAFFAAGNFFLRLGARIPDEAVMTAYGTILRLIVGIFLWSALLIMLGMINGLHWAPLWTAFILIIVAERNSLRRLVLLLFQREDQAKNWNWRQISISFLSLFIITFTLVQSLRPEPTGYDDMTQYMNRANLIAETEDLLSGGYPYPFELLSAGIRIISSDDTMLLAMSLGTYSLILGALILLAFGQSLGASRTTGLLSSTIYLSLPMSTALTIREVKPDPLLVALAIFLFWALWKSLQEKDIRSWQIAVFVFCFAITVKLTALFLSAPLFLATALLFFVRKERSLIHLKTATLTLGIALLALSPWLIYSFSTRPLSLPDTPQGLLLSDAAASPVSRLSVELSTYAAKNTCPSTGGQEDFARFDAGRGAIKRWLALPWDLTMNLQARAFATEITCLFLALLPLFLIVRKRSEEAADSWSAQPSVVLGLFALGYFSLWFFLGQQVAWYALPGFALLGVLIALLATRLRYSKILSLYFWLVIFIGLLGGTLVQMKLTHERAQLLYVSGQLASEEFLGQAIPSFSTATDLLNLYPDSRALIVSSQLWYGITDNHERAVMDSYLDMFNCLHQERDDALTLERLREFNIRYILYARGYTAELASASRPSFDAKIKSLTDFLGKNLRIVWGSPHYIIFEVQSEGR